MTTEEQVQDPSDEQIQPIDPFLRLLVSLANAGVESPVTLFLKGTVISGILVGGRTYFEQFEANFAAGFSEETVNELAPMFDKFKSTYDEPDEEAEAKDSRPLPQLIHMRDAQVYTPGKPPLPANGLLWRGRLSEVDGFSYGIFGPAPAE